MQTLGYDELALKTVFSRSHIVFMARYQLSQYKKESLWL